MARRTPMAMARRVGPSHLSVGSPVARTNNARHAKSNSATGMEKCSSRSGQVLVTAQPEALELRRGESFTLIPAGDLQDGTALTVPVLAGHAVVVPGWAPDADVEDLRALVGADGDDRWVEVKAAHVGTLFDGRPLVVLGLDRGVVGEGETVRGIGVAGEDDVVTPHILTRGVVPLDTDL